jgi:hypothetical protein
MNQEFHLDGFDLDLLQFDGKDDKRFKDNKEYIEMSKWIELSGGSDSNATWDRQDPIQGVYVSKKTDVGPNNSNMYNLKTSDGEVGVWGSTVIDSKFEQIPLGAEVRIEPLGMAKSKMGKEYADFKFQYREVPMQEVEEMDSDVKKILDEMGASPIE